MICGYEFPVCGQAHGHDGAHIPWGHGDKRPVFSHVYVWVNRGEWRTHTSEEAALSEARHAAMKANRWDEIMDADRIIIDKLPCDGLHDKELCNHLRVSFYQTKEAS